jgi:hypothetical protein
MDYEHDRMRDLKRVRELMAKFLRNSPLVKEKWDRKMARTQEPV